MSYFQSRLGHVGCVVLFTSSVGFGCTAFNDGHQIPPVMSSYGPAGGTPSAGASGAANLDAPCASNQECADRLSAANFGAQPAICETQAKRCVALQSADCPLVTGDYLNPRAVVIGALFSALGSSSVAESPWHRSAALAVSEINAAGGVPDANGAVSGRPLVLVSCAADTDLRRAGAHLIDDVHVPAIIGPTTSQDTLDLSNSLSVEAGVLVISPTAVASSIADLRDRDLTWLMAPSDVQRAPLMIQQINAMEADLVASRPGRPVRLGVIYRNDALGMGTRASLASLSINGKPLADPSNLGSLVSVDGYDFLQPNQDALVKKYAAMAPDIIVLAGTGEAITHVMLPLEALWPTGSDAPARPRYLLTDSAKLPVLLAAVTEQPELGTRIRGTGVRSDPRAEQVFNGFLIDYREAFQANANYSGMGSAYDAAYAIAYALAATGALPVTGASIAQGLRALAGGARTVEVGPTMVLAAFHELSAGRPITALGTMAPLQWDSRGAIAAGSLEVWCVEPAGLDRGAAFGNAGLTFDLSSQMLTGQYQDSSCGRLPTPQPAVPSSACANGAMGASEECDAPSPCEGGCTVVQSQADSCRAIFVEEQSHAPDDACDACRCRACASEVFACYHDDQDGSRAALCTAAAECAYHARCVDEACYCGTSSSCNPAAGACKIEFDAAAETQDASVFAQRRMDLDYALGRLSALGVCVARECESECKQ